jgi:type II secretory pathway pseudopilin PulG
MPRVWVRVSVRNVHSLRRQRGLVGLLLAIVLLLIAGVMLLAMLNRAISSRSARQSEVQAPMTRIQAALLEYVRINRRLPCPAAPTLDGGSPVPNNATAACTNPDGTVPWAVLGLSQADVLDPWGRKISYRVVSGARSATTANGLDQSQCDTAIVVPPADPAKYSIDSTTNMCRRSDPPSATLNPRALLSQLPAIPALIVTDMSVPKNDVAYVLINHGETGRGAYLVGGQRLLPLPVAGSSEALNTGAGVSYAKIAANASVAITDPAYFDDVVVYERLGDLIAKAGLQARDWVDLP